MTANPLKEKNGKTLLTLKVTPRGSANKIQSMERDLFDDVIVKIMVTALPEKGEANQAVIQLLAKTLKLPKRAFSIVAGNTARVKVISIEANSEEIWGKLTEMKKSENRRGNPSEL